MFITVLEYLLEICACTHTYTHTHRNKQIHTLNIGLTVPAWGKKLTINLCQRQRLRNLITWLFFIAIYFSLGELSVSLLHFNFGGETFDLVGGGYMTILKLGAPGDLFNLSFQWK